MQGNDSKLRTDSFQPLERRRISDHVYEAVLHAILEHRFKPGERLSIPELSQSLDVSQMRCGRRSTASARRALWTFGLAAERS